MRTGLRLLAAACAAGIVAAVPGISASPAGAGGYRASYFAATLPGTWSRYAMTTGGKTESEYLYRRLAEEDGRAQVEVRVDFTAGQFKGTWSSSRYLLAKDFRLEDDALSFGKHCVRLFMQTNTMKKIQETPANTIPYITDAAFDYALAVKFAGTETVDGRACDHYTYHAVSGGRDKTDFTGELWLNGSVPFGLVRESATLRDAHGKTVSQYSMSLVATGTDSRPAPPLPLAKRSTGRRQNLTFAEAYRKGLLQCDVRVDPASKNGARLFVVATNKGEAPLRLSIPAREASLEVGIPIETLRIRAQKARTFSLAPGKSTPEFPVLQEGKRRAVAGKFTISVYEGKPLFSGSVTVGSAD